MKIFNKNEWKKVKLGDVCDLRNGVAIKSEDYIINSNTLNCRMSNIRPDGTFDILYNAKYLPDNFSEKYKNYLLKNGDLVIAMTDMAGDPKILGVPTVVKSNGFNIIQNQRVGKLELLTDNIDENYLKFALQSKNVKNYFKKFSAGGVQLNLSKKEILNAPIVLPTIEEQKILVNLFKTIESFIYLRKKELLNLNSLNKSLFTKIFGDIKTNNKNWKIESLDNIYWIRSSKRVFEKDYKKDGIPFFRSKEVVGLSQSKNINPDIYISLDKYEELKKISGIPLKDDLLVTAVGTIGKIWKVDYEKEFYFKDGNLIWLQLKKPHNFFNPLSLKKILEEFINKEKENLSSGSAYNALTIDKLKKFSIFIPPIELQNKFAERIEKIEKLSFISKELPIFRDFQALYKKVSA